MLSLIKKAKPKLEKLYAPTGKERVGFLLEGSLVEVKNTSPIPTEGASVSAEDVIKYCDTAIAAWHTHPGALANLSDEDYPAFKAWRNIPHLIIGSDGVRCFQFNPEKNAVLEVSLD